MEVVARPGVAAATAGRGAMRPNALIWLIHPGAIALAAGVIALGVGLLIA